MIDGIDRGRPVLVFAHTRFAKGFVTDFAIFASADAHGRGRRGTSMLKGNDCVGTRQMERVKGIEPSS